MPDIEDWKHNPIITIDSIFENDISNKEKVTHFFKEKITQGHHVYTVNEMPIAKLTNGNLVRYRGMIQDQMENEFFISSFEVKKADGVTSQKVVMYRDDLSGEKIDYNSRNNVTIDRYVYYAIPVPGENDWLKNTECHKSKIATNKRVADEETNQSNKVVIDSERNVRNVRGQAECGYPFNFPLEGESGSSCVLKFYESNSLKVNDMIEVIGIIQFDENYNPRSEYGSSIPRIHVLIYEKIVYNNPMAMYASLGDVLTKSFTTMRSMVEVFTKALLGDEVTAQLLIYSLLSSVYTRVDGRPMGKYSLNIVGVPQSSTFTHRLYSLISRFVSMSHYLALTVDSLNTKNFTPRKDYERECLMTGMLQLANGTVFMIDEGKLTNGQLQTQGMNGITALGNMVLNQSVEYDFKYHRTEFNCDINVIVMSEAKSLFKCDTITRLQNSDISEAQLTAAYSEINHYLTDERLKDARIFFSRNRRLDYTISDEAKQSIESEFVKARKNNPDNMTVDEFNNLLILLRLMSKSGGVLDFKEDYWSGVKTIDRMRRNGLSPSGA